MFEAHGRPFAPSASPGNEVRDWMAAAALCEPILSEGGVLLLGEKTRPEVRATRSRHGIRKRCAEQVADASPSVLEVMAHLSHGDP